MEPSSSSELATLVAAWHNRHPLARRITPAQVQGAGLVALPFVAKRGPAEPAEGAAESASASPSAPVSASAPGWAARLRARLVPLWERLRRRPAAAASPATMATPRRPPGLRAAFDENFIAPLRAAQVARFARRQGTATRPDCPLDWPQRDVIRRPAPAGTVPQTRYLRTAAIEVGKQRRRVLIGAGPRPQVLGPRLWSRPRTTAAASVAAAAIALAAWVTVGSSGIAPFGDGNRLAVGTAAHSAASGVVHDPAAPVATASAPSAAVPAVRASAPAPALASASAASTPTPTRTRTSATATATATPGQAASQSVAAVAPVPAPAASGAASATVTAAASAPAHAASDRAEPPLAAAPAGDPRRSIRPSLSAEDKLAARQESAAIRAAHPASAASAPDGHVYAVATPATRTRAGAQLRIVLMNAPTEAAAGRPRAEVLQVGSGWRAVIWPFDTRDEAERAREQLASRGIPAEVIAF